jgi:hypothetical protein
MLLPYNFTFKTGPPDLSPPVVVQTTPGDGWTNIPISTNITIQWNESMNQTSANGAFSVVPSITCVWSWSGVNQTCKPGALLPFNTLYNITISTQAKDLSNNSMLFPYNFSFTTVRPVKPPKVVDTSPKKGATNVSLDASVMVTFDQKMNPIATEASFGIAPNVMGGKVNVTDDTLTWTHANNFSSNTVYTVGISIVARSADGDYMDSPYSFTFITVEPPKPKVEPARVEIDVLNPVLKVGGETDVYYNVFDNKGDPINTTKDAWEWTPHDAAEVTPNGWHRLIFKALGPGIVMLKVLAQGSTKTVFNTTNITVVGEPVKDSDPFIQALPYLIIMIVIVAVVALIVFMKMKRKKRKRPKKEEKIEDILIPEELKEGSGPDR